MDDFLVTIQPLNFTAGLGIGLVVILAVFGLAAKLAAAWDRKKQQREDNRILRERLSLYLSRGDTTNVAAMLVLHPHDFSPKETAALMKWLQERADQDE